MTRLIDTALKRSKTIIILGESHFIREEVDHIRQKVIKINPDVIIHELWWDEESFFQKHLPNTKLEALESQTSVYRNDDSLKEKMLKREQDMINRLNDIVDDYKTIVIVVGDTHLRYKGDSDIGERSPLVDWAVEMGAKTIRSSHKEDVYTVYVLFFCVCTIKIDNGTSLRRRVSRIRFEISLTFFF